MSETASSGADRISYGPGHSQFFELWEPSPEPAASGRFGTAVLIHGGYWRDRYGLDLMDPMAEHLQRLGWAVINLEYRRIPAPDGSVTDGVWAEMSADVFDGTAAGLEEVATRSGDAVAGPTVVIGHSAGGHLALWVAKALADRKTMGAIDLVVALAPLTDLVEADRLGLSDGAAALLLGGGYGRQPERYLAASPAALLPLGVPQLVIHGRGDKNVPHTMSETYVPNALAAGDNVELIDTTCVDHFDIINPAHWIWRAIDRRLALVSGHVDL